MSASAYHITHDIEDGALSHLSDKDKKLIIKLMARASERSFRRGFQQGVYKSTGCNTMFGKDLSKWRYGRVTDISPWPDSKVVENSIDRLYIENVGLNNIGLRHIQK